jgi:hypothetical protein
MDRNQLLANVEQNTNAALSKGQAALLQAVDRLGPLAEQARDLAAKAGEYVAPLAEDATQRLLPAWEDAQRLASEALERVQPALDDALARLRPVVKKAKKSVDTQVLPKLSQTLAGVSELPLGDKAALAVAKAEASVNKAIAQAEKAQVKRAKRRVVVKRLAVLTLVGAAVGAVAVVLKKLLAPPSDGWVQHTPPDAYIAHPIKQPSEDFVPAAESMDVPEGEEDLTAEDVAAQAVAESSAQAQAAVDGQGDDYGEGSYVGDNPPEGYTIKGNASSKKYHLPGQSAYDRCIAEVWFNSAEAAERAGFTAAKR